MAMVIEIDITEVRISIILSTAEAMRARVGCASGASLSVGNAIRAHGETVSILVIDTICSTLA